MAAENPLSFLGRVREAGISEFLSDVPLPCTIIAFAWLGP